MSENFKKEVYTCNRELSWLKFNERVLDEATEITVPLLEKLKFIAIFTSNLDEFFMVRVGKLIDINEISPNEIDKKSGWTAEKQLEKIYSSVNPLYRKKDVIFKGVQKCMSERDIHQLEFKELNEKQKNMVRFYFEKEILPILSPVVINSHHPFPHLDNKKVYIIAQVEYKGKKDISIIPIHSSIPQLYFLPDEESISYIMTEDIILHYASLALEDFKIIEKLKIKVTRNADINFEDDDIDYNEDFRDTVKDKLKKRKRLCPVKLEASCQMSNDIKDYLLSKLGLTDKALYITSSPMNLSYAFSLSSKLSEEKRNIVEYKPLIQYISPQLKNIKMFSKIKENDILLCYPYESMSPFLQLLKESSEDDNVISIKITIYRLSSSSKLVEYLCAAAENGKDVSILIELRARFDEQNNIDWSERLEQSGCNIIYGFEGFKVHSKICLITRKEKNEIKYYTQIGTGNYNEKTSKQYTDLSLMTYNQDIGKDANEFFKNMGIANLEGTYTKLFVAPHSFKNKIIDYIKEESLKGINGYIFIKINSLTDLDIITALRNASLKGVKIEMIIRGICCIIPNLKGETENIHITSIVGRFLEHSRIYKFGNGENSRIYIGSADFMTRNMDRRVEVAVPILQETTKAKINKIIEISLCDNVNSRVLLNDKNYTKKSTNLNTIDSQFEMLNDYFEEEESIRPKSKFFKKIFNFFNYFD